MKEGIVHGRTRSRAQLIAVSVARAASWLAVVLRPLTARFDAEIYDSCHDMRITQELPEHAVASARAGCIAYGDAEAAGRPTLTLSIWP